MGAGDACGGSRGALRMPVPPLPQGRVRCGCGGGGGAHAHTIDFRRGLRGRDRRGLCGRCRGRGFGGVGGRDKGGLRGHHHFGRGLHNGHAHHWGGGGAPAQPPVYPTPHTHPNPRDGAPDREPPGGGVRGGGGWHKALVLVWLPLAAPIGLSPPLILTLCGPERVLVVSTDDLSCLTTSGVGRPGDGLLPVHSPPEPRGAVLCCT